MSRTSDALAWLNAPPGPGEPARTVTAAARLFGVSKPTVSIAAARARALAGDPCPCCGRPIGVAAPERVYHRNAPRAPEAQQGKEQGRA